jgi:hypothetical protein
VTTPELRVVDLDRGDRWSQVLLMEATSATTVRRVVADVLSVRGEVPFVAVVSTDLGPELPEILAALRPGVREVVCFDALGDQTPGQDLAMRLLEQLGFGQDFVFTVPSLEEAVDYAVDAVAARDRRGWEGQLVVVLGPVPVVDRVRRHLDRPGPTG